MDNYIVNEVHISQIKGGDTIIHNDEIKTVCFKDIKKCSFMGKTIFGDSYKLGTTLVKRVTFKTYAELKN
jgi:hypothetical protein